MKIPWDNTAISNQCVCRWGDPAVWWLVMVMSACRVSFVNYVASSGDGDEDEEEERLPSCCDYVMHFLTVFWKVLFAFVPPTEYWNGWACFVVSIIVIGLLTAIIGDLASHFGCTVGLRDTVTAVVFVALGTSIPGVLEQIMKGLDTSATLSYILTASENRKTTVCLFTARFGQFWNDKSEFGVRKI